jgi:hypothetical protein
LVNVKRVEVVNAGIVVVVVVCVEVEAYEVEV